MHEVQDALRRNEFHESLARSEAALRGDPAAWAEYLAEAEMWAGDLDVTGASSAK